MRFTGGWATAVETGFAGSFAAEEAAAGFEDLGCLGAAEALPDFVEALEGLAALSSFADFGTFDLTGLATGSGFFPATFLESIFFAAGVDFLEAADFLEAGAAFLETAAFFAGLADFEILPLPETAAFGLAGVADLALLDALRDLAGTEVLRGAMKKKRSVSGLGVQEGAIQQLTGNTTRQPIAR